jgi:hypothetical protein
MKIGRGIGLPFKTSGGGSNLLLVNSAPLAFLASAQPYTVTGGNTISVSDGQSAGGTYGIALTISDGDIAFSGTTGLTGDTTGTDGTLNVTGSLANINTALNGLVISTATAGARTLSITFSHAATSRSTPTAVSVTVGTLVANTVVPAISGTLAIGSTLTALPGTWAGFPAPTITYQWQRGGVNIGGATSSTYVLQMADFGANISCEVTGTNSFNSVTEETGIVTPQDANPVNTVAPAISGTLDYGNVLTCSNGTWTGYPAPTLTKQWQKNGTNISGQTGNTYTSVIGDVGSVVTCEVTGTNTYSSAISEAAGVVVTDSGSNAAPVLTWVTLNTDNTPGFDIDFSGPQIGDQVFMVRDGGTPSTSDAAEITSISPINTLTFLWSGVEEWPDDTYDTYVYVMRGATTLPDSNTVSVEIDADVTAPTLSSTSPTDNATGVSLTNNLTATFNENIVFGTGNIILRENNSGWSDLETFDVTTEVGTGAGQVSISGTVLTINPTASLTGGREYAVRIAATAIDDTFGNSFAGIANDTTWSFTAAAGDVTAPVLTSPTAAPASTTTGTGGVTTDEGNGTLYFVVTASATPPSAAQVKAGQNNAGAAAVDSGSQSVTGTGAQSITGGFSGLTAATNYYAYYMHEDAATNQSTVASSAVFRTHFTILTNTAVDLDYQNDQAYIDGTYYASMAAARTAGVVVQTSSIDRVATSEWSYTTPCTVIGTGVIAASLGSTAEYLWCLDDGADATPLDELVGISLADIPPNTANVLVYDGSSSQVALATTTGVADGATFKAALRIKTNNVGVSYGGAAAVTDTAVTLPTVTQLVVGNRDDGARTWNGTVRRIQILNEDSTNANLVTYAT